MVACRLQNLVLVVGDGCEGQHLVQNVELRVRPLFRLLLLLEQLSLIFRAVVVEALRVDALREHPASVGI